MSFKLTNWISYLIVVISSILLAFFFNRLILNTDVYYNTYKDQLSFDRIDQLVRIQIKYVWVGYLVIPIWLLVKNIIISLCLQTGLILNNLKLRFSVTFRIAIIAEFIFLLPQLIRICWFMFANTDYTLPEVQQFYPLSVLNLFKIENLSVLLVYPFQTLNVFEVLYWVLLAGGIKEALNGDLDTGFRVVFSGYIPALFLWILCITFIVVSLNPNV